MIQLSGQMRVLVGVEPATSRRHRWTGRALPDGAGGRSVFGDGLCLRNRRRTAIKVLCMTGRDFGSATSGLGQSTELLAGRREVEVHELAVMLRGAIRADADGRVWRRWTALDAPGLRSIAGAGSRPRHGLGVCVPRARVTARDLSQVRALIAAHPQAEPPRPVAAPVCGVQWVQPNGHPRECVPGADCSGCTAPADRRCRRAPLAPNQAARAGAGPSRGENIDLTRCTRARGAGRHSLSCRCGATRRAAFNAADRTRTTTSLHEPVCEHLKYLVYAAAGRLACVAGELAPRHLARATGSSAVGGRRGGTTSTSCATPLSDFCRGSRFAPSGQSSARGPCTSALADLAALYDHPVYFAEPSWIRRAFEPPFFFYYRAANVPSGRPPPRGRTTGPTGRTASCRRARLPVDPAGFASARGDG